MFYISSMYDQNLGWGYLKIRFWFFEKKKCVSLNVVNIWETLKSRVGVLCFRNSGDNPMYPMGGGGLSDRPLTSFKKCGALLTISLLYFCIMADLVKSWWCNHYHLVPANRITLMTLNSFFWTKKQEWYAKSPW